MNNTSPFAASMFGIPDKDGVDTLYVVVKATFELGRSLAVAPEQPPVVLADDYRGEPGTSSLRAASEAHPSKLGTDVLVVGEACAPAGRPVSSVDVGLGIAGRNKQARVFGDRYWTEGLGGIRPSRPKEFVRIPVTYERAFGGTHRVDPAAEKYLAEPRNPVGCGFGGKQSASAMLGQPVPNVEDPRRLLSMLGERPVPVGFGPIAPQWEPRVGYAGTYDEVWEKTRAPYLPRDFDPRFLNVAPPDQVFLEGLVGGEPVALLGFDPQGMQRFSLPRCELEITARVAGQEHRMVARLETVLIEPTDARLSMSWRAWRAADKQLLMVEQVTVALQKLEGATIGGPP